MRIVPAGLILMVLLLPFTQAPLPALAREPMPSRVQVLVVGASPAGIAAAVAAARAGMTTLLVDRNEEIGGDVTLAWLNMLDLNRGPSGQQLTKGIFGQMYRVLGQTFDIDQARIVFDKLVSSQPNLTVLTQTGVVGATVREHALTEAMLISPRGRIRTVAAEQFIDATDDASLATVAHVPFTVGREESGLDRRMQAATLIVRLAGLDYPAVRQYIQRTEKRWHTGGVRDRYVWGYGSVVRRYQPHNPRMAAYDLNLGWQTDDSVLINSLQISDVDGADPQSLLEAREQAVAELPYFVEFLRSHAPGFANAYLVGAAPHLYVRETRHLACLYRMNADDILDGHDFWDRIAIASYPIDLHPYVHGQMNPFRVSRRVYAIPFRILVPQNVDRLFVVGKPVGATWIAAGSLRVVPTGMAMGEAAGEAAAMAIRTRTTPMLMAATPTLIAELQRRLTHMGAYLPSPAEVSSLPEPRPVAWNVFRAFP